MAKNGRYEAPGEVPILVTDGGELPDGRHGPWVYYKLDLPGTEPHPVLWLSFEALCRGAGYKHVEAPQPQPEIP